MRGNVTTIHFEDGKLNLSDSPLYQYDYGQVLILDNLELPEVYEVHFANSDFGNSKTSIGGSDGVEIPDEFLLNGEEINVWLFLHVGEDDGETEVKGVIPVIKRAKPTNVTPTPVQQDAITQAIAALNTAVEETETNVSHYPKIVEDYWYIWDAENGEWVNTNVIATPDVATTAQTQEIINEYEE